MQAHHQIVQVAPDTGSLRGDVIAVMQDLNSSRTEIFAIMVVHLGGFYQEAGSSPAAIREAFINGRTSPQAEIEAIVDEIFLPLVRPGA